MSAKTTIGMATVCILSSLFLAGCSGEETKTVEYYETHLDELQTKLNECANNPGELKDTPNCQNAMKAELKNSSGRNKDLSSWNRAYKPEK